MLYILKILTKFGVALQTFVKIKILFRIRIRIVILLWISIPDRHFIHRRPHQIIFRSANSFKSYCAHSHDPRTYRQTTKHTSRQKDGIFFLLEILSSETFRTQCVRHTNHKHSSKEENFLLSHHIRSM